MRSVSMRMGRASIPMRRATIAMHAASMRMGRASIAMLEAFMRMLAISARIYTDPRHVPHALSDRKRHIEYHGVTRSLQGGRRAHMTRVMSRIRYSRTSRAKPD